MNSELITCPNCGQETEYHFQDDELKHWELCHCAKQYKQIKLDTFDLQIRRIINEEFVPKNKRYSKNS
jgi:hypothetical protein